MSKSCADVLEQADRFDGLSLLKPRFAEHAGSDLNLFVARGLLPRERYEAICAEEATQEWFGRDDGLFGLPDAERIGDSQILKDFGILCIDLPEVNTSSRAENMVLIQRFVLFGSARDELDVFKSLANTAGYYLALRDAPGMGRDDQCLHWLGKLADMGFAGTRGAVAVRRIPYRLDEYCEMTKVFAVSDYDLDILRKPLFEYVKQKGIQKIPYKMYIYFRGYLCTDVFVASLHGIEALEARRRQAEASGDGDRPADLQPDAPAHDPPITLKNPGAEPIVRGKKVRRLSMGRTDVIMALLTVWPKGLTKDELVKKSGRPDAVNILKKLCKNSLEWGSVIQLPGREGRGLGYRIAPE